MNKELLTYLKSYSYDPFSIDRLIVSAFLYSFNLQKSSNQFLQSYIIQKSDVDYKCLLEFQDICHFTEIEDLIQVFEFVISPEEKVVTGAVYTPKNIREYIVEQCFSSITDFNEIKVCDPACGCGGFLYTAAQVIKERTEKTYRQIFAENIFGLDIQEYAITRSQILLSLLALSEGEDSDEFEFNLFRGNALNFNWDENVDDFPGFDVIVGNPPYVCSRNIDEESKQFILDWEVSASGHPDLYIPFFQLGIESLRPQGVLGYITMNTFFKSVNGRALREYFEKEALAIQILDFGGNQIFESKSTYTCICIIQKQESAVIGYVKGDENSLNEEISFEIIPYSSLNHKNGWNLHQKTLIGQIERSGQALGELYRTRNGIATLKNDIYIFKEVREDDEFYYLQNGALYPIEKGICKEIINPNKFTQPVTLDSLRQKAIFPYEFNIDGSVREIEQEELADKYPRAFQYLEAKRDILATRDKGKGAKYEKWYVYGRNQSLEKYNYKMFFPHITPHTPHYTISNDENLLFYNGIAVVSDDEQELKFLQKLMGSRLFWFYIENSSKPYGSGYFSLSRNYIKNFGIADFSEVEKVELITADSETANQMIEDRYEIVLP